MRTWGRLLSFFAVLLAASGMSGQYFGQNRVRYRTFDFKVLKTQHFDIYYYPQEHDAAVQAGRMAERWYVRLSKLMEHVLSSRQPLILYASPEDFRATTVIPGYIGEATGGVTEPIKRRVVLPLAGSLADTDHVIGHELVHAFQYDIGGRGGATGGGYSGGGIEALPLWFIEGMAEYLSLGPVDPNTAMWMRDAVAHNDLPRIKKLDNPKYFPYRWGQALWAYIGGRWGDSAVGELMKAARGGDLRGAFQTVLHIKEEELSRDWQQALRQQYDPVLKVTQPAGQNGRVLFASKKAEGSLNVSPVVSPDGKYMILYSSRSLLSVDLYLADAQTGHIIRRITSSALNPHMDALEFVSSAGGWSADSRQFAFSATVSGVPQISLYDLQKRKVVRRLKLKSLGEVLNIAWAPDGKTLAISGMEGGYTELFLLDLASGKLRNLTNDAYADLQPAWSPDGRRIAFATDRFTSDLAQMNWGDLRLAVMDVATGDIRPVQGFDRGKQINPQWSSDGNSLYFVADPDGISNVYRVSLTNGDLRQLTNLQTGASGITATSPVISVAANDSRLVFTVFDNANYELVDMSQGSQLAGQSVNTQLAALNAAVLPPRERASGEVATLLEQPETGLAPTTGFQVTKYQPKFSLDYVAPPTVAVGLSNYGALLGGGTALYFSDMLNYNTLMIALQSATFSQGGGFTKNFAGIVGYQNQRTRWDWGLIGGQVPFITGGVGQAVANVSGEPALVQQSLTFWEINRELSFIAAYPFSRAQRVEFTGGFRNISYAAQEQLAAVSLNTGNTLLDVAQDLPTCTPAQNSVNQVLAGNCVPSSLRLGTTGTALVYDTSLFGGTSPIAGQRYRLQGEFAGGTLNFGTLIADYRRYLRLARPLSLAGRFLHYGRYGGGEDPRLGDLFIGYDSLVRGYDPNSFSAAECGPNAQTAATCSTFDNLVGSRMAVGNAEVRLQLFGPLGIIPSRSFVPVELAPFYDVGRAWGGTPGVQHSTVSSEGVSLRINILGFAVGQISYARPNDRPLKKAVWQFTFIPGW